MKRTGWDVISGFIPQITRWPLVYSAIYTPRDYNNLLSLRLIEIHVYPFLVVTGPYLRFLRLAYPDRRYRGIRVYLGFTPIPFFLSKIEPRLPLQWYLSLAICSWSIDTRNETRNSITYALKRVLFYLYHNIFGKFYIYPFIQIHKSNTTIEYSWEDSWEKFLLNYLLFQKKNNSIDFLTNFK